MDDAVLEGIVKGAAALEDHFHGTVHRQQITPGDVGREVAAGNVLHHEMTGVLGEDGVVDGDDVRMVELPGEGGLDLKLRPVDFPERRMLEERRIEHLQRDVLG